MEKLLSWISWKDYTKTLEAKVVEKPSRENNGYNNNEIALTESSGIRHTCRKRGYKAANYPIKKNSRKQSNSNCSQRR